MLSRQPCATPTDALAPNERMRWFTGRYLSARDLTDEQNYHVGRHRLHNRLFHPSGIVCGLEVCTHDRHDCASTWIWVKPGIAVDCLGREIIVECPTAVEWPADPRSPGRERGIVLVRYFEKCIEPAPTFVMNECSSEHREPSRIVETADIVVVSRGNETYDCWAAILEPAQAHDERMPDCDEPEDEGNVGCLEPDCPCGEWIPLAVIERCGDFPIEIDCESTAKIRPASEPPPQRLTRITGINWKHGAQISRSQLEAMSWQLRVTFDRLLKPEHEGIGLGPHTFVVEIEDINRSREQHHNEGPLLQGDGCTAIFNLKRKLANETVFITIYGDLIHDCNDQPVDADFFGTIPSGDGRKGGVFRSWFEVTP